MKRLLIILFVLLGLFSWGQQVKVNINAPVTAKIGERILVKVVFNKNNIKGFARFEQNLPNGYKVEVKNSANAKFEYEMQTVKCTWMDLPKDDKFTISYYVIVPKNAQKTLRLNGKFSYLFNNGVQAFSLKPFNIDIENSNKDVISTNSNQKDKITAVRYIEIDNDNFEAIVTIRINKGDHANFGKIQENIPEGFIANSIETQNGIFTLKGTAIKFLWMNMPKTSSFDVSYKLVPKYQGVSGKIDIDGKFYWSHYQQTKSMVIENRISD